MKYFWLIFLFRLNAFAAAEISGSNDVQEMTVAAPRINNSVESLLEIRKQSQTVSDVLGAEAMSRSGDSDAAASLRRVTGLTLVNGKYVYVRGLGERYSSVLLNGSQVPSPEPTRRVVPLDLFPVSILESITVQKSFSPNRPAEFGGGLIELQTKPIPKKFTGSMSIGVSTDSFNNGLSYKGGRKDELGMDDGGRAMPAAIKNAFLSNKKIIVSPSEGFTEEEIVKMGSELSNDYNVSKSQNKAMPNFQVSLGDSKSFGAWRTGGSFGGLYSQASDAGTRKTATYNVGNDNKLERDENSDIEYNENEIQLGGALNFGFSYEEDHSLKLTSILLRNTTNLTQEKITEKSSDSFPKRKYTLLEWSERQLLLNQLSGEHNFEKVVAKWRVNKSTATRESPDSREIMRNYDNSLYVLETDVSGNKRVYSELEDKTQEVGLDLDIKVYETEKANFLFKLGGVVNQKNRKSDVYRLHFKNNYAPSNVPDLSQDTETILSNRGPDSFLLTNITDSADSFKGEQNVVSLYSALESNIDNSIGFSIGVRNEDSLQKVKTYKYYAPNLPTSEGQLRMKDLLPSYNVSYKFKSDQKIRLAYGETIARPDFRELSTVSYIEDETGYDVIGNSSLKGTIIKNWDLRFENYFDDTDYFSVGVFLKDFASPIEAIFQPGDKLVKTFVNAKSARSYGAEIEGRASLSNVSRLLRRWSLSSNLSIIESSVSIDESQGNQTSNSRPLQGQSPYVANIQLLYDRPQFNITGGLIFNVVGRRITEVGTNSRPDTYEEPVNQLDFVLNQKFDDWGYGFKAKNLLDEKLTSTQGDEIVRERKRGRVYAINLSSYF